LAANYAALKIPAIQPEELDLLESLQFLVESPVSVAVPDL
jgi:hypothetical protein